MTVVTRFAPSPTGKLHIGGARTALFNWLYAKHMGGTFKIRIEDTDADRSTPEMTKNIFEGLAGLGIDFDGDPVIQSANKARHAEVVKVLLDSGNAYHCYMTAEETAAARDYNMKNGTVTRSPWRGRTDAGEGSPTVRLKIPENTDIIIDDLVRGRITFNTSNMDDLIVMRSDGNPIYNLAVVVDDHDMGVTHVIRGEDHISNAAKQAVIYDLLGWDRPVFAHIPLINGEDGKKLSKRHGAADVQYYLDLGYLTEGLVNYLCRLGWGHGDDEIFSLAQAIDWFDVSDVVKAPARLDLKKLNSINSHYINLANDDHLLDLTGLNPTGTDRDRLLRAVGVVKAKASTIVELKADVEIYSSANTFVPELDTDAKSLLLKIWDSMKVNSAPRSLHERALLTIWNPENLHEFIHGFSVVEEIPLKIIGPALRLALTGRKNAPELHNIMFILGYDETARRLEVAVS